MTVRITVVFDVLPDRLESVVEAFEELVIQTRPEPGALQFDVLLSDQDDTIVLMEEWTDRAALDLHKTLDHFIHFQRQVKGAFRTPPQIHRLRPLPA